MLSKSFKAISTQEYKDGLDQEWLAFKERMQDPIERAKFYEDRLPYEIESALEMARSGDHVEAKFIIADLYERYCTKEFFEQNQV